MRINSLVVIKDVNSPWCGRKGMIRGFSKDFLEAEVEQIFKGGTKVFKISDLIDVSSNPRKEIPKLSQGEKDEIVGLFQDAMRKNKAESLLSTDTEELVAAASYDQFLTQILEKIDSVFSLYDIEWNN